MAKPTFLGSVVSGVTGAVKGAIGLGILAAGAGAIIGIGVGAFTAFSLGTIVAGALLGAEAGGLIGAVIGTPLGALTGIVKSRETNVPEAQDVINLAKISFAQGVTAGRDPRVSQAAVNQVMDSVSHQDREDARRALAAAVNQRA